MRLGKVGYYSEFVVYPVLAAGMAVAALWNAPDQIGVWLATVVGGAGLWTVVEYVLPRFVIHNCPFLK